MSFFGKALACAVLAVASTVVVPATAQAHDSCRQPTHVWVHTQTNGNLQNGNTLKVTTNTVMYLTGIVHDNTPILFTFTNISTRQQVQRFTTPSKDNCVVHHDEPPNIITPGTMAVGTWFVQATYVPWENNPTDRATTTTVGTLVVNPPSGGGGGGGGGCTGVQLCPL